MQHLDDAALRFSVDGGGDEAVRDHLVACAPCSVRRDAIAANAAMAARALGAAVIVDSAAAYGHARRRAAVAPFRAPWMTGAAGLAAAAVLLIALAATPLGGIASRLLTVFQPDRVAAVQMDAADADRMGDIPPLAAFGTLRLRELPPVTAPSLAVARSAAGFTPRSVAYPPAGSPLRARVFEVPAQALEFTFDAAKAARYESRNGATLPPMPPLLDGTTIRVVAGPSVVRAWGGDVRTVRDLHPGRLRGAVVFVESRAPRISSTRAGLDVLEAYLLKMPNVPARVGRQLRAIADPARTLPIPLVTGRSTASAANVGGVRAVVLRDRVSGSAEVVWERHGILYALLARDEREALALARSVR